MSVFDTLRADYRRNRSNYRFILIVTLYRIANSASRSRKRRPWASIWAAPVIVLYRFLTEWLFHMEVPAATQIGPGLIVDHGYALVINKHAVIGANCRLRHCTTIGCKINPDGTQGKSPLIGNDVEIGANSVVLGPITIGNRAVIGAGAVVVSDIPEGGVAVGNPARVVKINGIEASPAGARIADFSAQQ